MADRQDALTVALRQLTEDLDRVHTIQNENQRAQARAAAEQRYLTGAEEALHG
jgi:hypothetical protein